MVEVLTRMGGVATRVALLSATSRAEVDAAVAAGDLHVLARGRYALPSVDAASREAHRLTAVVSHLSAALLHGWAVKVPPERPTVTLPRNRKLAGYTRGLDLRRADLGPDDVVGIVTSPERTLLDCLRHLPFDDALAVADSALRTGFSPAGLALLAGSARGPGARQVRRVAAAADARAANPFESVLRASALQVSGLHVRPQVPIYAGAEFLGRPDLVDTELGIVLEADSFEWHGNRAALAHDTRRYDALVVHGWLVLRFCWEDVMFDQRWVLETLRAAVAERTQRRCRTCRSA